MLLFLKRFLLILTLALMTFNARAFALLGPLDDWQQPGIGYDTGGFDIGGPKLLHEEWRWNVPTLTYAFDQSFINWFGTNGIRAVEAAFAVYNAEMTNLASVDLRTKPLSTRQIHLTAQALTARDLKSETMTILAEELGLANAERFTWTLRSRTVANNVTNYLIIPMNYDPFTRFPSPYVNGVRYSFNVIEYPQGTLGPQFADASEFLVDQTQQSVAGSVSGASSTTLFDFLMGVPLLPGEFFTGLTRDDVGGLKFIYERHNINRESMPPGTFFMTVDSTVQFIPGFDLFTFSSNSVFLSTSNLLAVYPGLAITSSNFAGVTGIVSTNIFITNILTSGLFLDETQPTIFSNRDLFTFSEQSRTNRADVLRALYPGLIITKTNPVVIDLEVTPIFSFTNYPWAAAGDPPQLVTTFVTNFVPNYQYEYANVITNYASAVTDLEVRQVTQAPFSSPNDLILATNTVVQRIAKTSGGFFLLDRTTNASLIAYSFTNSLGMPLPKLTNLVPVTSVLAINPVTGERTEAVNIFTNVQYVAFPLLLNGSLGTITTTNTSTNFVPTFTYTFANVVTNLTSNTVTLRTTTFLPPNLPVQTVTTIPSPFPQGTILLLDTNQFRLIPNGETIVTGFVTNTLISFTNATTGAFIVQEIIRQTNGIIFAVNPVVQTTATNLALRPGINSLRFVRATYRDFLGQTDLVQTNIFTSETITNSVVSLNPTIRTGPPDFVFSAADLDVDGDSSPFLLTRSAPFESPTATGQPGIMVPQVTIVFSKLFPSLFNTAPGANEETSAYLGVWGSFDLTTITPIIYPEDFQSQLTLEDIALGRTP